MPDELVRREQAREAIRSGKVPSRRSARMFGGPGSGRPCVVCGEPLPRAEIEIELEFNLQDGTPDPVQYRFHHRCFTAWEFERANGTAPN
jgi:hypothetical protein